MLCPGGVRMTALPSEDLHPGGDGMRNEFITMIRNAIKAQCRELWQGFWKSPHLLAVGLGQVS